MLCLGLLRVFLDGELYVGYRIGSTPIALLVYSLKKGCERMDPIAFCGNCRNS